MIICSPFQNCSNNFLNPKSVVFSHLPQTCWLTGNFSQMWAGTRKLCCWLWREKRCSSQSCCFFWMILYHCGLLRHDSYWRLFITPGFGHNPSKFSWILFWSCIITFITDLCKNMTCSCCLHLHLVSLIKSTLRHSLKWLWLVMVMQLLLQ